MRHKDRAKQDAIFRATVKLVNQIGFVSSSVSKIATEANVSPATLYIYYENKEDLLVSTYVDIKQKLSTAILEGFDDTLPIREILHRFWFNAFGFVSKNPDNFQYTEQFANSPYRSQVNQSEIERYFEPMLKVIGRGIQQKIIKDVSFEILQTFIFHPVLVLAKTHLCANFECSDTDIETAFLMAWDAIKL